ncbi:hypothetical protein [Micromonospora okii]|uniref:hypothetical protein n=1 Tax=Micromonospora okii TaxID=1182970 RepID=UPI001E2E0791|nr:hypothetical protein [Micromonospora okii]
MSSPEADTSAGAREWLSERLRHLLPGTPVTETDQSLEIHLDPGRRPRICLLCCWHEPWAEAHHGVSSPVSLSALYTLEVLDLAARHPRPRVSARFIARDTMQSRIRAFALGREMLDTAGSARLVVVAAGCAPGGGFASADAAPPPFPGVPLPALDRSGLDDDVIDELDACHAVGVTACVLDPILDRGGFLEPGTLWAALQTPATV